MTLHWWMHWFWITCHLFAYTTHSSPLNTETQVHLEGDITQNGVLHRSVKSIGQTPPSRTQAPLPFPVTSDTLDTVSGDNLPDPHKTKTSYVTNETLCGYGPVTTNNLTTSNTSSTLSASSTSSTNKTHTLCYPNNSSVPLKMQDQLENVPSKHSNETVDVAFADIGNDSYIGKNVTDDVFINSTLTSVITTNERIQVQASENVSSIPTLTAASITGISFGVLMFASLVGVGTFFMYRRRYLNKPQTLNDKCSNPDSSGYIDDSTIRENSEEMYSLDNDSFLNSLEAMTIQNYWTDSVKHTKL